MIMRFMRFMITKNPKIEIVRKRVVRNDNPLDCFRYQKLVGDF